MSDVLSDEIQKTRRRFQHMLTKTAHLESTVRELNDKLKSKNKQLQRDTQERDNLLDKVSQHTFCSTVHLVSVIPFLFCSLPVTGDEKKFRIYSFL